MESKELEPINEQSIETVSMEKDASLEHPKQTEAMGMKEEALKSSIYPIMKQPAIGLPSNYEELRAASYKAYFKDATTLKFHQELDLFEVIFGWRSKNAYEVSSGENKLFHARETSNCCCRQVCKERRPFDMALNDKSGNCIIAFERDINCSWFCGSCFKDSIIVNSGDGHRLGSVVEEFNLFYPRFELRDALDNVILKLRGPFWNFSYNCGPVTYDFTDTEGKVVGKITKEWSSIMQEVFTNADDFTINLPQDIDPAMKAVCLGALYLLEFRYYEAFGGLGPLLLPSMIR